MEDRANAKCFKNFSHEITTNFENIDKNLTKELLEAILIELEDSFGVEELSKISDFEEFWERLEQQYGYEEEWYEWKGKGVERIYRFIWENFNK